MASSIPPTKLIYPLSKPDKLATVNVVNSASDASGLLSEIVRTASRAAIAAHDAFTLVLSGGSLPQYLTPLSALTEINWSKVYVFFVDERNVSHDSADSSFRAVRELFLSKVPIPEPNIFAIGQGLSVLDAAKDYESRLRSLPSAILPRINNSSDAPSQALPVFDLTLLGVGPDGHVASLFPGSTQLLDPVAHAVAAGMAVDPPALSWVLPVADSPKPPPERITFTMPVINVSKEVVIVSLGAGKADIVHQALEGEGSAKAEVAARAATAAKEFKGSKEEAVAGAGLASSPPLPVQWVQPASGSLQWILDEGAAAKLLV